LLLAAAIAAAQTERSEAAREQLEDVRRQIESLQKDLVNSSERRDEAQAGLRKAELAEQLARQELAALRQKQVETEKRRNVLRRQADEQRAELDHQRELLSEQLRLAYVDGTEEWLRLVLSQKDPASLGRQLTYYEYINRYRGDLIGVIRQQLRALEEITAALAEQTQRLAELGQEQARKLPKLSDVRQQRAELLASIDQGIGAADSKINRLRQQEQELQELVTELVRIVAGFPSGSGELFSEQHGHLAWPTAGSVVREFGQPRSNGRLRWNGVLMEAPAGAAVMAVYNGRVIFSDWLPGMGLLLIVEHGEGYLSLYGHNQDLLKEVGDWVLPGEVIAHVGDSGGQASAGLYFEIRKDGSPVNPGRWMP
jgi:septal ring factor EnvC (AmiA/AmiB activator)